jgi:hypothetical protein
MPPTGACGVVERSDATVSRQASAVVARALGMLNSNQLAYRLAVRQQRDGPSRVVHE